MIVPSTAHITAMETERNGFRVQAPATYAMILITAIPATVQEAARMWPMTVGPIVMQARHLTAITVHAITKIPVAPEALSYARHAIQNRAITETAGRLKLALHIAAAMIAMNITSSTLTAGMTLPPHIGPAAPATQTVLEAAAYAILPEHSRSRSTCVTTQNGTNANLGMPVRRSMVNVAAKKADGRGLQGTATARHAPADIATEAITAAPARTPLQLEAIIYVSPVSVKLEDTWRVGDLTQVQPHTAAAMMVQNITNLVQIHLQMVPAAAQPRDAAIYLLSA
jgi:hypothetical protein